MRNFSVTYEIITEESATHGEAEETGFVVENASLRDCIPYLSYGFGSPDCAPACEADSWPVRANSRVRLLRFADYYIESEGDARNESRTLHIPDRVTDASSRRIFRLFRWRVCSA